MQKLHNPVERDGCGVPVSGTYPPERALMDTETDTVYPTILPLDSECIFCSLSSYSTASHGSTADIQEASKYMTCLNCSSEFCSRCIHELIQSVEGFKTVPTSVKKSDATYKKLIEIQKAMSVPI